MGLFKPRQNCEELLRQAIKAVMVGDDSSDRLFGKLSRYPTNELLSAVAGYGFDMRQAGVGDDLIEQIVAGMAPADEPSRSAFIAFGQGMFSGDAQTAADAAGVLYHDERLPADEREMLVVGTIVTAARIAERHDLPI